ncbi:hypothetical protein Peur_065152 [Populus x canadensis]
MRNSADVEREHGLATSALHGKGRLVSNGNSKHISLHKACDQGLASSLSRILKAEEIKRLLFFFPCFFTMELARSLSFQFPWSWQVSRVCPSPCFEALGPPHLLERKQHLRGAAS